MGILESLASLSASPLNAGNPNGYVQSRLSQEGLLAEMKRKRAMQGLDFGAGATDPDIEDLQRTLAEDPSFGDTAVAHTADQQKQLDDINTYNNPDITKQRNEAQANALALKTAPNEALSRGQLAVEQEKTKGALALQDNERAGTQKLLESLGGGAESGGGGGGNGLVGPGGTVKPTINAHGGVSFTTTQMPALIMRARSQLTAARDQMINALDEAEKQYPGVNDAAQGVDQQTGGSALGRMASAITGIGAPKYGGPSDRANAGLERLNYTMGVPTPFTKLAQSSSFANIEQMSGQLPGVRGLSTLVPLFREHQASWGHESPVTTIQRMRHMAQVMDETIGELDHPTAAQEPQ